MTFLRSSPPVAARHDIYVAIHKGLRAFMTDTLQRFGRLDPDDAAEVGQRLDALEALLEMCEAHIDHENRVIHPALEAASPGSSEVATDDHVDHQVAIARLRRLADELRGAPPGARTALVLRLYRALSCFVGDNLLHMHVEETEHNAQLWQAYTDAELQALEGQIVASLSPHELMQCVRWMVPAVSPAERLELLAPMAAAMPPAVFEDVYAIVRGHLSVRDFAKLERGLRRAA